MRPVEKTGLALIVSILLFVGCGSSTDKNTIVTLPTCLDGNNSNGYLVQTEGNITKLDENTSLQIWHYENADKIVCVKQGKAIFTPTP